MKKLKSSLDDIRKSGLGHSNTILAFKLQDWQIEMLKKVIIIKEIKGRKLNIYETDIFTDLLAVPYFMAFINFEGISENERQTYRQYWEECREPLKDDFIKEFSKDSINSKKKTLKMPLACILNFREPDIEEGDYLYINQDIFSDKEKLRLTILQEIKNIEGKGRAVNTSDRSRRILFMYHQLVYKGWITRDELDKKWVDVDGERQISNRTFSRDVATIKEFDRNVRYNKVSKRYELNVSKYLQNERI
jgi:hypothetical protein